jgi:uncharacterized membrane protein YphA (DoxX/SURF4 family)
LNRMTARVKHKTLTILIALVWLVNGLFAKLLGLVPPHETIVQVVTHVDRPSAALITAGIGLLEILMSLWVISKYLSRTSAIMQIVVVATMNILEFILAPDLLLWGRMNSLFAFLFLLIVYYNEFILKRQATLEKQ